MRKFWLSIFLVVIAAVGIYVSEVQAPEPVTPMPMIKPTGAVKEIPLQVNIRGFFPQNPSTWFVTEGDTVRILVTSVDDSYAKGVSEGAHEHTFNIDEYNIHLTIPPGETRMAEFMVDDRAERVAFYCSLPGHRYQENGVIEIRKQAVEPTGFIRVIPLSVNIKGFTLPSYYAYHATSNTIKVNLGDTVRLIVTSVDDSYAKGVSEGAHEHTFNIDEYNIHRVVPAGESIYVEFLADKPGHFTYYCDKPGHRYQEQGTLLVGF